MYILLVFNLNNIFVPNIRVLAASALPLASLDRQVFNH